MTVSNSEPLGNGTIGFNEYRKSVGNIKRRIIIGLEFSILNIEMQEIFHKGFILKIS